MPAVAIDVDQAVRSTSSRGDLTEIEITAALMRAGRRVLRPISAACRYDLLIDNDDGTFVRVQCKTGVLRGGSIVFRVYSVSGHRTTGMPYHGQIDAFGVHCPAVGSSYLVPIDSLGTVRGMVALRVSPARNGQVRRTREAATFAIRATPCLAGHPGSRGTSPAP